MLNDAPRAIAIAGYFILGFCVLVTCLSIVDVICLHRTGHVLPAKFKWPGLLFLWILICFLLLCRP